MGIVNLLLDTCAFLWLALPQGKLSGRAIALLDDSANALFISDASVWEISLKYSAGKLPLPGQPRSWLPPRLAFFQVEPLPLTHEILFRSGELPQIHGDPFDRLLAAHAIEAGMTVLSPDRPLSMLGASRVW